MTKFTALVTTTAIVAALAAAPAGAAEPTLKFSPVPVPVTDAQKRDILASDNVTIGAGATTKIGYNTIARSGDKLGGGVFGLLVDKDGKPVKNEDGSEHISVSVDFSSLLMKGDKLYNVTHFESRPGAMYLTELEQDGNGMLKAKSTKNIDFSAYGGLWVPCAGSVTPWGNHLGGEEYPPNAREVEEAKELKDIDDYYYPMVRYFGVDPSKASADEFRAVFNPYNYGYPTEILIDDMGGATPVKHYSMGRVAIELAYVMPDRKTAYITDDGTNVGLFMFVADKEADLSAGTLYALKWHQTSSKDGGSADISWVNLGHASNKEIASMVRAGTKFSDIFETAKGDKKTGACPSGFKSTNTTDGFECLKLKPGMEVAASRLETRRYAAYMGATTEFRKMEGITFDPKRDTMYLAMSAVERGMQDHRKGAKVNHRYDIGGPNDIRVGYNSCGVVYGMTLGSDMKIGSDYVIKSMYPEVVGQMAKYAKDSDYANNKCHVDGIANPDNVTFITDYDTLIIGEDTGSGHQNDVIWAYDVNTKDLTRIQTTPYGSETTSPYWYGNYGGHGYLMSVIQHPYGESDQDKARNPADTMGYVGYIGPFPAMAK